MVDNKRHLNAIGLMSGTSMDGIDVALLRSDGDLDLERGPFLSVPYMEPFRADLADALHDAKSITDRTERPGKLAQLERQLTLLHEDAVRTFLDHFKLRMTDIDLIGFHGQTVTHQPDKGLTVQLGDGQLLADQLGLAVVYDMRANDMVHGGQGAPLAPAYHRALAENLKTDHKVGGSIIFLNIGGISNLTSISRDGDITAFDCGPGNALIDQWVKANLDLDYDEDGQISAKGEVMQDVAAPYLEKGRAALAEKRALDRLDFPPLSGNACSTEDGARTLCYVSAQLIAQSAEKLPETPELWVLSGGGRLNPVIIDELRAALGKGAEILMAEDADLNGDAIEAEAWAYLAIRAAKGLPLTFPGTTGVTSPCPGGVTAWPQS